MTTVRPDRFGPTWRAPSPHRFESETTWVFCACGVDMRFRWPRTRESVRCFGCGSKFARPPHFPERARLTWNPARPAPPPAPPPTAAAPARARRALGLAVLGVLLVAVAWLALRALGSG